MKVRRNVIYLFNNMFCVVLSISKISFKISFLFKNLFPFKNVIFIQKLIFIQTLYIHSITFQFVCTGVTGQSHDRMISTYKYRRKVAHMSCRLKQNVLNNSS